MSAPTCSTGCGRPSPGAFICRVCTRELEKALAELPSDLTDLQAVATMQAVGPLGLGDPGREWCEPPADGALGDSPWVFAPAAADQIWVVENTLSTWARHICESRGLELADELDKMKHA